MKAFPSGGRGTTFGGGRRVRKLKIRCYTQVTHSPSVTYGASSLPEGALMCPSRSETGGAIEMKSVKDG